jgi:hypothetical protein
LHAIPSLGGLAQLGVWASLGAALALTVTVFVLSVRYGIRRLHTIEP